MLEQNLLVLIVLNNLKVQKIILQLDKDENIDVAQRYEIPVTNWKLFERKKTLMSLQFFDAFTAIVILLNMFYSK